MLIISSKGSKNYFFAQEIDPQFWPCFDFLSEKKFYALFYPLDNLASFLQNFFENAGMPIYQLAIVIHDKDVVKHGQTVEAKVPHVHMYFEFQKRVTAEEVASVLKFKIQYIKTLGRGRYAKENALAYMIHAKQPEKHQYQLTEVWSNHCSFAMNYSKQEVKYTNGWYQDYVAERLKRWQGYNATAQRKEKQLTVDLLIQQILRGKYATKDQLLLDDQAYDLYIYNKSQIDNAFDVYAKRKALKFAEKLATGKIHKQIVFVSGLPRTGKTHFVRDLISALQTIFPNYSAYYGGGANAWDAYDGQEIAVLDDIRVGQLSADAWTHLLDPDFNMSQMDARYNNKMPAYHFLIITNYQDPVTFFTYMPKNEDIDQFLGRITYNVVVASRQTVESGKSQLSPTTKIEDEPKILSKLDPSTALENFDVSSDLLPKVQVVQYAELNKQVNYLINAQTKSDGEGGKLHSGFNQKSRFVPIPFFYGNYSSGVANLASLMAGKQTKSELFNRYVKDTLQLPFSDTKEEIQALNLNQKARKNIDLK